MTKASAGERFLRLVGQQLRRGRERFFPPEMAVRPHGDDFAEIWFPTGGCLWDFQGYCTMCNYGHPRRVSPERMVQAVEKGLAALDPIPETLWVSSFNVLDEREVPASARREIFRLLAQTPARRVLSESHPDSVRTDVVRECVEILDGRTFGLEIGVESTDTFVRNWCINKAFDREAMRRVTRMIHAGGAKVFANLLLGSPFLTPLECILDVVRSVRDGAELGFDHMIVFPNHVKDHTVVQWLHAHGLYRPPSLWALVDVLRRLEPELRSLVGYAWILPVDHPGAAAGIAPALEDPDPDVVVAKLQAYYQSEDPAVLDWLFQRRSPERDAWAAAVEAGSAAPPLVERLSRTFPLLGRDVLGDPWWDAHGGEVLDRLAAAWESYEREREIVGGSFGMQIARA